MTVATHEGYLLSLVCLVTYQYSRFPNELLVYCLLGVALTMIIRPEEEIQDQAAQDRHDTQKLPGRNRLVEEQVC